MRRQKQRRRSAVLCQQAMQPQRHHGYALLSQAVRPALAPTQGPTPCCESSSQPLATRPSHRQLGSRLALCMPFLTGTAKGARMSSPTPRHPPRGRPAGSSETLRCFAPADQAAATQLAQEEDCDAFGAAVDQEVADNLAANEAKRIKREQRRIYTDTMRSYFAAHKVKSKAAQLGQRE